MVERHFLQKLTFPLIIVCLLVSCYDKKEKKPDVPTYADYKTIQDLRQRSFVEIPDSIVKLEEQIRRIALANNDQYTYLESLLSTSSIYKTQKGNNEKALYFFDSAQKVLNQHKLTSLLPKLYIVKGTINFGTDTSILYYQKAIQDTQLLKARDLAIVYGNFGRLLLMRKKFDNAERYTQLAMYYNHQSILPSARKNKNDIIYYTNLYQIYLGKNDSTKAIEQLQAAYSILKDSLPNEDEPYIYQYLARHYIQKNDVDSVEYFSRRLENIIKRDFSPQYLFHPNTFLAQLYLNNGQYSLSEQYLQKASSYNHPDSVGDAGIQKIYFDVLYQLNKRKNNSQVALHALEKKDFYNSLLHEFQYNGRLAELEEQLKENETKRLIQEKQNRLNKQRAATVLLIFFSILSTFIGILVNANLRRKRVIEKKQVQLETEQLERKRIAQEIHDDLGANLTIVKLAAHQLKKQAADPSLIENIELITTNTKEISLQLNEIVWSLNGENHELSSLVNHIENFAAEFLHSLHIQLNVTKDIESPHAFIDVKQKRLIFQTCKEILNNAAKYSGTTVIDLVMIEKGNQLSLSIKDYGKGLPNEELIKYGNGLKNIQKNISQIKGTVHFISGNGLLVKMEIPL